MHKSTSIAQRILSHPRLSMAFLLLLAGGLLGALSAAGLHPACAVAAGMSADGVLSDAYVRLLRDSQRTLAGCFLATGVLFSWIDAQRVLRFLQSISFRKFALAAGLLGLLSGYAVQEGLFDGIPHVTDATSHLFQAKIFAAGRMWAPAPACPDAFWQPHVLITHSGKWFTKYTPGHALLLAAGIKLGLLKWVLPLCLLIVVVSLGRLLEAYEGRSAARVGMVLLATSPLALLLGGSFMSHVSAMAGSAAGVLCWTRFFAADSPRKGRFWAAAGGFLLAASALTRPHEVVLMGFAGALFSITWSAEEWRGVWRSLPWLILGAVPVLAFWMQWNLALYGRPFAAGYGFSGDDVLRPAFQGHLGFSPSFGLREAVSLWIWNLTRVNESFLGWPVSLLFVPFAFIRRGDRVLLLSVLGALVGMGFYFFYEYRGELESRYYFLILPFFVHLTVRGMRNIVRFRPSARWRAFSIQGIGLVCLAFGLHAALFYWPRVLAPRYGDRYEEASTEVERATRQEGLEHALVLVGPENGSSFFYTSGFIFNDPLLREGVVYARDMPGVRDCLREAFPLRKFYEYERMPEGPGCLRPVD